ncbi:dTDP-4-dehydrorhamnose reductase [Butyricicoccus faecihominis]|uniref:dTDP-4-dehydrorhamnose reductase n=1 Tax=Butyricicoccus faecihominis TaxID=1712515 RepID=UPI00247A9F5E|nr:dTDP-4-dehydrorhamnose reductase [Butyricicoccus faecihominis]MCQ5131144.1 dTDP-4-dehydrorhamnose reductase [Butyricicoccus faecihominis]
MRILVTGVGGQLGYDVCKELTARKIENKGVDIADFDITDAEAAMDYITQYQPNAVIHCSAYTAVDKAEEEPERVHAVNADGPRNIAAACRATGAKMIYISTDYVFPGDGEQFYEVDDRTGPLGVYGETKLAGEIAVKELLTRYFIVRVSWAFGKNGNNFVRTMLRLSETHDEVSVVDDQIGSPTYTADLAPLLCDMAMSEKYGTYHATNEGICSFADLAEETFRLADKKTRVRRIPTSKYPAKARRPLNSRLSKASLDAAGWTRLPSWQDAVRRYIKELKQEV